MTMILFFFVWRYGVKKTYQEAWEQSDWENAEQA